MARNQPSRASKAASSQEQPTIAAPRARTKSSRPVKPPKIQSVQQSNQVVVQKTPNANATSNTNATPNSNSQAVTLAQSLEVVQTLLHSCLSSLAFTRGLFMENVYQKRFYHAIDSHWSYNDFASGKHSYDPKVTDLKMQGLAMWAFNRGVCKRVDRFLEIMEDGVFDALRRGYLESLLVIIREHSESPDNMLERYTFTFEKSATPDGSQVVSGVVMSDLKGTQVKMHDARRSLSDFVRKLLSLCYDMPALPDRAKLSLEITYTENCPIEYYAPHFPHTGTTAARFPDDERCEKQTVGVGKLSTGFHSVALKVSHLEISTGSLDNKGQSTGTQIPSDLNYGPTTDKFADIETDFSAPQSAACREVSQLPDAQPDLTSVSDLQVPTGSSPSISQNEIPRSFTRSPTPAETPSNSRQTHEMTLQIRAKDSPVAPRHVSTRAAHEREKLRKMLQPMSKQSDAQDTQIISADTQLSETNENEQEEVERVIFSADTIERLDLDRSCRLPDRKATRLYHQLDHLLDAGPGYKVNCECGFRTQEPEMLHCGFCDKLQHVACYGYDKGAGDERIPEIQVCYTCLLKKDEERLSKLKRHAFYRRAIHPLLCDASFETNKSYAQTISYSPQDVSRILKKLDNDRLLASSGTKKGRGPIALAREMYGAAVKTYFDPTFLLSGHIEAPIQPREGHHGPSGEVTRFAGAAASHSVSLGKRGLDVEAGHVLSTPKKSRRSGRPAFDLDTTNYPSPQTGGS